MFKGILFDIDGTLTSTNELIFSSFNYITKKYLNKTLTNEEIIGLFGPTEDEILQEWFNDNYEEIKKDYYDFYLKNHQLADLYPGIKDLLDFIKSKRVYLGVYTGKGKRAAVITLKEYSIYDYFDMIITGDDLQKRKSSGEGILNFMNRFSLAKENILMIGDSPADVKAAKAAGVRAASVLWDSYSKEKVLTLQSDYYFYSVEELKDFIEASI
jgi:HAD superfamily hydrolase (TIGR01549 family)